MWTSSSTTSGSRAERSSRTAASTSPASPTTSTQPVELGAHAGAEEAVVVDDARRSAGRRHRRQSSSTSSTSVPVPGRAVHGGAAAVAGHAADDRLAHAAPVGGHRVAGRSPGRGRGRRPRRARRRPRRRARSARRRRANLAALASASRARGDQRAARVVERRVADGRRPRSARRGPPRPRRRRRAARRRGARRARPSGAPDSHARSSRSWRRASVGDRARVVGALLDERQRLQHRVVQVGGDLGALLRADALGALGRQAADEPQPERREDRGPAPRPTTTNDSTRSLAPLERAVGLQEQQAGADDQRDAEAALVEAAQPLGGGPRRRRGRRSGGRRRAVRARRRASRGRRGRRSGAAAGLRCGLAPHQRAAGRGEHERPDDRVAPPQPELARP